MCGDNGLCPEGAAGRGRQTEDCLPGSVARPDQEWQWRLLQLSGQLQQTDLHGLFCVYGLVLSEAVAYMDFVLSEAVAYMDFVLSIPFWGCSLYHNDLW